MNDESMDPRMAALAVATASSLGDAKGCADALTHLPSIERFSVDYDVEADIAIFSGAGTAS